MDTPSSKCNLQQNANSSSSSTNTRLEIQHNSSSCNLNSFLPSFAQNCSPYFNYYDNAHPKTNFLPKQETISPLVVNFSKTEHLASGKDNHSQLTPQPNNFPRIERAQKKLIQLSSMGGSLQAQKTIKKQSNQKRLI
jgi:hypothetical protein